MVIVEAVSFLLAHGANPHILTKFSGETPLLPAASRCHTEAVRLLLEFGADVNLINNYDETALVLAVRGGRGECLNTAELLLEEGADIEAMGQYGYNALLFATSRGNIRMVRLLLHQWSGSLSHKYQTLYS